MEAINPFLYSSSLDPRITLEMVADTPMGVRMPQLQGFGTAYYAHQRYPDLSLENAVRLYIEDREKSKQAQAQRELRVEGRKEGYPDDFLTSYFGIKIANWGNYRNGTVQMIVGDRDTDNMTKHRLDFSFVAEDIDHAEKVVDEILYYVSNKGILPKTFAFDNHIVFILS